LQRDLSVDILINNAGFATHGLFEQLSGQRQHEEVMLNLLAVVDLTHLFLPEMLKRKSGVVINVASTAGFQPLPKVYQLVGKRQSPDGRNPQAPHSFLVQSFHKNDVLTLCCLQHSKFISPLKCV
jgi:NAD(P)-dependent dehydrogenase (short-subunit alcohol dehydrogenase family)